MGSAGTEGQAAEGSRPSDAAQFQVCLGDIVLFEKTGSPESELLRAVDGTPYAHAAIVTGVGPKGIIEISHAVGGGKCRQRLCCYLRFLLDKQGVTTHSLEFRRLRTRDDGDEPSGDEQDDCPTRGAEAAAKARARVACGRDQLEAPPDVRYPDRHLSAYATRTLLAAAAGRSAATKITARRLLEKWVQAWRTKHAEPGEGLAEQMFCTEVVAVAYHEIGVILVAPAKPPTPDWGDIKAAGILELLANVDKDQQENHQGAWWEARRVGRRLLWGTLFVFSAPGVRAALGKSSASGNIEDWLRQLDTTSLEDLLPPVPFGRWTTLHDLTHTPSLTTVGVVKDPRLMFSCASDCP